ncbi:hypothetical protein [Burkholderia perseverans]|uniref:hypothetical protein n=1 Tax=Burkholderia perseverans TaxID=2615214 RepID=UPI001FED71DF|nr:hypothetical protein [Burkholderia perseverans]
MKSVSKLSLAASILIAAQAQAMQAPASQSVDGTKVARVQASHASSLSGAVALTADTKPATTDAVQVAQYTCAVGAPWFLRGGCN